MVEWRIPTPVHYRRLGRHELRGLAGQPQRQRRLLLLHARKRRLGLGRQRQDLRRPRHRRARIGVDGAGNLVAAWSDARTTPSHVRVARKPAGGSWSASIEISPAPANAQSLALSVRADGFAWAVWGDTRGTSQDIWGSRYDPNLGTWSTPLRLDDDPGTTAAQSNPTVAFGAAETMLSWRDNRLSANGDTQARRVLFIAGMNDHFALAYDGLNRLKSVGGPVSETFTLDGASNITARTGPNQTDTYDTANRLTSDGSQSYTWSNADRLTNRAADTFGYDPLDRLTSSTVAGTARTYAYNGDGLLQSRTGAGAATFLWDPSLTIQRLVKQGNDNIVYGLGPLYVVKADATTVTFARDGSKNTRAEVTSSGAVSSGFRYRVYGQLAQSTGAFPTYLGLAGQLQDPSGLTYMRARWYDPVAARFTTRDAATEDIGTPGTLNPFAYAAANPIRFADPAGLRVALDDQGCESSQCDSDSSIISSTSSETTPALFVPGGTRSVGISANVNIGIGIGPIGFNIQGSLGLWLTPKDGLVATATEGGGTMTGATAGFALTLNSSNAESGSDIAGPFVQHGASAGEVLVLSFDQAKGRNASGKTITVTSVGAGFGLKLIPVEAHSGVTNTLCRTLSGGQC